MRIPVHLSTLGSFATRLSALHASAGSPRREPAPAEPKKGPADLAGGNHEIMAGNGWKMAGKWQENGGKWMGNGCWNQLK